MKLFAALSGLPVALGGLLLGNPALLQSFPPGQLSNFVVPATGTYQIDIAGSKGGNAKNTDARIYSGRGRSLSFDIHLTQSQTLSIVVGTVAGNPLGNLANGAGQGGGASLVSLNTNENQKSHFFS
jgi:hypothetical protein